ncbi:MAG: hypothetical protein ACI31S_03315 [Bacilli bacterium]
MNKIYQESIKYENLINNLKENYKKIDNCYMTLLSLNKKMEECLKINNVCFSKEKLDNTIKALKENMRIINDELLPVIKKEYSDLPIEKTE